MLKKKGSGFVATSSTGRPLSKKTKTKSEAIRQVVAVEYSKARKAGKKKPSATAMKKALK